MDKVIEDFVANCKKLTIVEGWRLPADDPEKHFKRYALRFNRTRYGVVIACDCDDIAFHRARGSYGYSLCAKHGLQPVGKLVVQQTYHPTADERLENKRVSGVTTNVWYQRRQVSA